MVRHGNLHLPSPVGERRPRRDRLTGADTRIGGKYLKGAMGFGGPCFPRDNVAYAALARKLAARLADAG